MDKATRIISLKKHIFPFEVHSFSLSTRFFILSMRAFRQSSAIFKNSNIVKTNTGQKSGFITIQYLLTAESVLMVAMGDLIFFKSQIFTLRSSDPDTTLSPCKANTAVVTGLKIIIFYQIDRLK